MKQISFIALICLTLFCQACKTPWAKQDALKYLCSLQTIINTAEDSIKYYNTELKMMMDSAIANDIKYNNLIQINQKEQNTISEAIRQMEGLKDLNDQARIRQNYIEALKLLLSIPKTDNVILLKKIYNNESTEQEQLIIHDKINTVKNNNRKVESAFDKEFDINKYDLKSINDCVNNSP